MGEAEGKWARTAGQRAKRDSTLPELRRMIRQNFRPRAEFILAGRAYLLHPVTLYTYLLPLTMLATGLIKPEFTDLGVPEMVSHVLTALKVVAYWLFGWFCLGRVAWFALNRGLPFFLVPIGLWLMAVLLSQTVSLWVIPNFEWSNIRLIRQATLTIPATLVAVYAAGPMLRARLGEIPDLVPIWSFRPRATVPLLLHLPADRRGTLRRIHAANQYVEVVTDRGTTLLRLSLREAAAQVPDELGWLCHRSLWIRRDDVVALTYVRGQPQILDRDGQSWPVSRSVAPLIKAWLHASHHAPEKGEADPEWQKTGPTETGADKPRDRSAGSRDL